MRSQEREIGVWGLGFFSTRENTSKSEYPDVLLLGSGSEYIILYLGMELQIKFNTKIRVF